MAKVYEFLADGFEEIEALAPVDVLRRGGVETVTVSIMGRREVVSAHGVTVVADLMIEEAGDFSDADMLLLPGGMPGSTNLRDHQGVIAALQRQAQAGKRVGALPLCWPMPACCMVAVPRSIPAWLPTSATLSTRRSWSWRTD